MGTTVQAGDAIGRIGVSPCAQYTQAHVDLSISSDGSDTIVDLVDQLYEALPEDMAELKARESESSNGLTYEQAIQVMINYGANKNNNNIMTNVTTCKKIFSYKYKFWFTTSNTIT